MARARIAVIGRDAREWFAACNLSTRGHDVVYVGPVPARGINWPGAPYLRRTVTEALRGREVVVGPVTGLIGNVAADVVAAVADIPAGSVIILGKPSAELSSAANRHGWSLIDLSTYEPFVVKNAVLTAEGAIAEAIINSQRAIWSSRCIVTGFGRVGRVLVDRLLSLGAAVTVCSADAAERSWAMAAGGRAVPLAELASVLPGADFVFNTIPARVIKSESLRACSPATMLVDLASPPGGFDREALQALGLTYRWSLGIPGRITPRTAGQIVAESVNELITTPAGG